MTTSTSTTTSSRYYCYHYHWKLVLTLLLLLPLSVLPRSTSTTCTDEFLDLLVCSATASSCCSCHHHDLLFSTILRRLQSTNVYHYFHCFCKAATTVVYGLQLLVLTWRNASLFPILLPHLQLGQLLLLRLLPRLPQLLLPLFLPISLPLPYSAVPASASASVCIPR